MSRESRMTAGILLVVLPSVMYGGLSLLMLLQQGTTGFADNPLRHDLWRAGHAHAGVYLVLSLVMLRYVDETVLSRFWKWIAVCGFSNSEGAEFPDEPRVRWCAVSRVRRSNARCGAHTRCTSHGNMRRSGLNPP